MTCGAKRRCSWCKIRNATDHNHSRAASQVISATVSRTGGKSQRHRPDPSFILDIYGDCWSIAIDGEAHTMFHADRNVETIIPIGNPLQKVRLDTAGTARMSAARLFRRLHELGASSEVILAALEELESEREQHDCHLDAERAKRDQRLARDRDRKARKRATKRIDVVSADCPRTPPPPKCPPHTPPITTSSVEPDGSTAPVGVPVYTDARHELWGEGVKILVSLGVPERQTRSMIGSWLKQTRDDAPTGARRDSACTRSPRCRSDPLGNARAHKPTNGGSSGKALNGGFAQNSVAFAIRTAEHASAASDHDT